MLAVVVGATMLSHAPPVVVVVNGVTPLPLDPMTFGMVAFTSVDWYGCKGCTHLVRVGNVRTQQRQ
jgi:hypothetical protein